MFFENHFNSLAWKQSKILHLLFTIYIKQILYEIWVCPLGVKKIGTAKNGGIRYIIKRPGVARAVLHLNLQSHPSLNHSLIQ